MHGDVILGGAHAQMIHPPQLRPDLTTPRRAGWDDGSGTSVTGDGYLAPYGGGGGLVVDYLHSTLSTGACGYNRPF